MDRGSWAQPTHRFGTSGTSVALQGVSPGTYDIRVGAFRVSGFFFDFFGALLSSGVPFLFGVEDVSMVQRTICHRPKAMSSIKSLALMQNILDQRTASVDVLVKLLNELIQKLRNTFLEEDVMAAMSMKASPTSKNPSQSA